MKRYYISSKLGESGISKYSEDFFNLVLKNKGYIFVESSQPLSTIMTKVHSIDKVHIEIGIFQTKEIEILFTMLNAGYKKVDVTLHDAPLIRYPFYDFPNKFIRNISKFYDIYINKLTSAKQFVEKINRIYVLSKKGVQVTKDTFKVDNVHYLPHIINDSEITLSTVNNSNFIYFGFVGKNKGIEYSLKLHQEVLKYYPDSNFYVVGKAIGIEKEFYENLKTKYTKNVHFLGYVPESEVENVFALANFAILPFKSYRFYLPISGSILYNQKKGKVVFTTQVNVIDELIDDNQNGYFLSGVLKNDIERIRKVLDNPEKVQTVKNEMFSRLMSNHTPKVVSQYIL